MTNDAKRAAIKKMIAQHTKNVTASAKTAQQSLVKEGVYTNEGKLSPDYGGQKVINAR
ncbi:hypothetical protein [Parvibaculum sedimenti]|uniref:hypothetical protein n=1 Tax=Parvibaculum sedimenti TaxID=2608632 RepID=UPI00163B45F5|nr:hypothetical protein [Parvibaculum sedimenti]